MSKTKAYWSLILFLALLKFALPFILVSPVYELHRDEFLYYQQGQHLSLGYLENPPLIAYLARLSSLFGDTIFWIKLWPSLFGAATLIITCLITAELGGKRFAQFIAALCILCGSYMRIHFLFQPNFLDIFFWTLSVYFLIRYINTGNSRFTYWLAISLALGWWGKFSILFMAAAIVAGLALTHHRRIFLKRQTWLALALALVIMLPNLIWQYQHNWPLLHHMQELREKQLGYISPADFLKEQFFMLIFTTPVWIAGLVWLIRHREYRIISFIYLTIILLLVLASGKGYYALGAYPMLMAAGAVCWQNISVRRVWIRWVLTGFIFILSALIIPVLLPVYVPAKLAAFNKRYDMDKKWEDQQKHPLSQDFADMLGWKELTQRTEQFYRSLPDTLQSNTIIYCRNYGQAGAIRFYSKNKSFTDKVITDNGSFLLWIPASISFQHLILIGQIMPEKDDPVFQHFQSATVIDSVRNTFSRQQGDKVIFFRNADDSCVGIAQKGLSELKKQFSR